MQALTRETLLRLAQPCAGPCLSIYLSAGAVGESPLVRRLEHAIDLAETQLRERDVKARECEALLAPGRRLIADLELRQNDYAALAMLITPERSAIFRFTYPIKELVLVGQRLHLKPLLPLLVANSEYYLLALSKAQARLFRGLGANLEPLELPGAPDGLADLLRYDEFEPQRQLHHGVPGRGGERGPIFHGQGGVKETLKPELERYCRAVDQALHRAIPQPQAPLILSGVDYLLAIFRAVSTYPSILEEAIFGSPDHLPLTQLGERASALMEPRATEGQADAAARFTALAAKDPHRVSRTIRQALPAAVAGQIESIFVAIDDELWGDYEPATGQITLQVQRQSDEDDLLDRVAVETLAHGGMAYAVPQRAIPDGALCAAVLRVGAGRQTLTMA